MRDAPLVGECYEWEGDPGTLIWVLGVTRKYARIHVVQRDGGQWEKRQPLPFPETFTRVTPPEGRP